MRIIGLELTSSHLNRTSHFLHLEMVFLEILLPLDVKTFNLLYIIDIFLSCAHIFVCSCDNVVIIQGQGGLLRGHCVEQSLCIATR